MAIFNLADSKITKAINGDKKYITAMPAHGTTHIVNRQPYTWWDYEQVASATPADWAGWTEGNSGLADVFSDARFERQKWLYKVAREFGVTVSDALRLVKTYIGYHPAYGAYLCQLGPYVSNEPRQGTIEEGEDKPYKFAYFTWRKSKSSEEQIQNSLTKNIEQYMSEFNIGFEKDDFQMILKARPDNYNPRTPRQEDRIETGRIPSLGDETASDFFRRAPVIGSGSYITLNNRGYEKILSKMLGPWYQETLNERATSSGMNRDQIIDQLLHDEEFLKNIYNTCYNKYREAVERGEAAATGMMPPPKFRDPSLEPTSGAQRYTAIPMFNEVMTRKLEIQQEIARHLSDGVTDPQTIANIMNQVESRIKYNARRVRKKDPSDPTGRRKLQPVIITPEFVQQHISTINAIKQQMNINNDSQFVQVRDQQLTQMRQVTGYNDLRTAFEMAAVYFSTMPKDPLLKSSLGSQPIIFDPPENFENFTSEDLKRLRTRMRQEEAQITPEAGETPEQAIERARIEREMGPSRLPARPRVSGIPTAIPSEGQIISPDGQVEAVGLDSMVAQETAVKTEVETGKSVSETESQADASKTNTTTTLPPTHPPEEEEDGMASLLSETFRNLIKIAEDLDKEGKVEGAEEIHNIIRKYGEGLL